MVKVVGKSQWQQIFWYRGSTTLFSLQAPNYFLINFISTPSNSLLVGVQPEPASCYSVAPGTILLDFVSVQPCNLIDFFHAVLSLSAWIKRVSRGICHIESLDVNQED
jgi:hypothetical protein